MGSGKQKNTIPPVGYARELADFSPLVHANKPNLCGLSVKLFGYLSAKSLFLSALLNLLPGFSAKRGSRRAQRNGVSRGKAHQGAEKRNEFGGR